MPLLNIERAGHGSKRKKPDTIHLEDENAQAKKAKAPTPSTLGSPLVITKKNSDILSMMDGRPSLWGHDLNLGPHQL